MLFSQNYNHMLNTCDVSGSRYVVSTRERSRNVVLRVVIRGVHLSVSDTMVCGILSGWGRSVLPPTKSRGAGVGGRAHPEPQTRQANPKNGKTNLRPTPPSAAQHNNTHEQTQATTPRAREGGTLPS